MPQDRWVSLAVQGQVPEIPGWFLPAVRTRRGIVDGHRYFFPFQARKNMIFHTSLKQVMAIFSCVPEPSSRASRSGNIPGASLGAIIRGSSLKSSTAVAPEGTGIILPSSTPEGFYS